MAACVQVGTRLITLKQLETLDVFGYFWHTTSVKHLWCQVLPFRVKLLVHNWSQDDLVLFQEFIGTIVPGQVDERWIRL